jgi:hypothetical protein
MKAFIQNIASAKKSAGGRRGTVLLLALLVLSSVVISASGLSSLILNSLQQARIIDSSIVAYYAAEGAAEQSLYTVRKTVLEDTWESDLSVPPGSAVKLQNGATWYRTVSGKEQVVNTLIPQDSFYEVALYNPDQEDRPLDEQIGDIRIDWSNDPCSGEEDICPSLIVTMIKWDPTSSQWATDEGAMLSWRYASDPTGATSFQSIGIDPSYLYKMRLRAEDGDIKDVMVRGYTDSYETTPVDLPGRIRIDAYGSYGSTRQHLSVRLPRRTPLSGLFDFALFSECSLVKGYPISCP